MAVDTELWAAYMDMSGSILGMEWWPINRGYFSVESLEEWCSWQTATCQGHTGWDRLGVPQVEFRQIRTKRKEKSI